jgi:surface antigen
MSRNPLTPFALLLTLLLAACGGGPSRIDTPGPPMGASSRHPGINCAPFARELSGIALYGEAADWWPASAGRYSRAQTPVLGAALVFTRSSRLPSGHVAVVSRLIGPRQIQVTQANWIPGQVDRDQLVIDVSERNDWTEVRVWYTPGGHMGGSAYPTYGFIHPPRPASHEDLARATEAAARFALNTTGRPPPRARNLGG